MSDFTALGVVNTFDALNNGIVVDTSQFVGNGSSQTHDISFSDSFALILGDTYTLSIVATSTVPPGLSSWNWLPGGTVTLNSDAAVPAPSTLGLIGLGLLGLSAMRRRRQYS